MSNRISLLLTVLLVTCALALVNTQYQARRLFIELEREQTRTRQLDIDWAQLQLDQSTLGKNARIEANARLELNMVPLTPERTQYLSMDPDTAKALREQAMPTDTGTKAVNP